MKGQNAPLKVAVIGLTHTHVHWIFESEKRGEIDIVGIVEPNRELAGRYAEQHGYGMGMVHDTAEGLLAAVKPEAVTAFGTIYEHLEVVQTFAPLGVHVMVEKPLAVSLEHARQMEALAKKHGIQLLTNYETTWYPTTHKAYELAVQEHAVGALRKVVVRDGHKGPKRIGVNEEFLEWLTDPELNGGGAITDFGCYGVNLLTWLMQGQRPNSVTAITQQLQAENNPAVDDEAIILLQYDSVVAIIQASWNWPIGRKDMELYGTEGVIYADNRHTLRLRLSEGYDGFSEEIFQLPERPAPYDDPFALLAGVIKGAVELAAYDLSALDNNMIVMEILDAAIRSAESGRTVRLRPQQK